MPYSIKTTPHFFAGTLGVEDEPHLLLDPETRDIEVFETREDAQARVDALDAESPYILRHGEYARPDYEVLDLDDDVEIEHLSSEDDDLGDVPEEWRPLARAVAETLRKDNSLTFDRVDEGEITSDDDVFGLRAYVAAPTLAMDVAKARGAEWWEVLDFSPERRAIRGEFEVPEDLAAVLNFIRTDILPEGLAKEIASLPNVGSGKPN